MKDRLRSERLRREIGRRDMARAGVARILEAGIPHDGLYPLAGQLWCACGDGPFTGEDDPAWHRHSTVVAPLTEEEGLLLEVIDELEDELDRASAQPTPGAARQPER